MSFFFSFFFFLSFIHLLLLLLFYSVVVCSCCSVLPLPVFLICVADAFFVDSGGNVGADVVGRQAKTKVDFNVRHYGTHRLPLRYWSKQRSVAFRTVACNVEWMQSTWDNLNQFLVLTNRCYSILLFWLCIRVCAYSRSWMCLCISLRVFVCARYLSATASNQ